jgi:hypothetical protein
MFNGSLTGTYFVESNPVLFTFCPENKKDMAKSANNQISYLRIYIGESASKSSKEFEPDHAPSENRSRIEKLELASEVEFNRNTLGKCYLTRKSHEVKNVPG